MEDAATANAITPQDAKDPSSSTNNAARNDSKTSEGMAPLLTSTAATKASSVDGSEIDTPEVENDWDAVRRAKSSSRAQDHEQEQQENPDQSIFGNNELEMPITPELRGRRQSRGQSPPTPLKLADADVHPALRSEASGSPGALPRIAGTGKETTVDLDVPHDEDRPPAGPSANTSGTTTTNTSRPSTSKSYATEPTTSSTDSAPLEQEPARYQWTVDGAENPLTHTATHLARAQSARDTTAEDRHAPDEDQITYAPWLSFSRWDNIEPALPLPVQGKGKGKAKADERTERRKPRQEMKYETLYEEVERRQSADAMRQQRLGNSQNGRPDDEIPVNCIFSGMSKWFCFGGK